MKRVYAWFIHLTLLIAVLACDNSAATMPQLNEDDVLVVKQPLTIQSGDNAIPHVSRLTDTSGNLLDESEELEKHKPNINTLPYIPLGEKIQLMFENGPPMSYTLLDDILNKDGTKKYSERSTQKVAIQFEDKIGTFVLAPNIASFFSSDSQSYEPGQTIRGFRLTCHWEHQTIEYAFIVRTDASRRGLLNNFSVKGAPSWHCCS